MEAEERIKTREEITAIAAELRQSGKKIVFTNGCFDIIHSGHVTYLKEAQSLGDVLILGLNTDESVKRLKGESRPVNNEIDRAIVISSLRSVNYVTLFSEDTPYDLIKSILPDVLVKGGDYTPDKIHGADIVNSNGGEVVIIPLVPGKSTTKIIDKLRNSSV